MPRVVRDLEMMDVDELVVLKTSAPEPAEPPVEPEIEKDEEDYEETITLKASDFVASQDILEDIHISDRKRSEGCSPRQARDPGHAPSHLRQVATSLKIFCITSSMTSP
jgi:hypothetical protein